MPNPGTFPIKGLKIELEGGVALDLTPEETTAALQVILSFHRGLVSLLFRYSFFIASHSFFPQEGLVSLLFRYSFFCVCLPPLLTGNF